MMLLRAAILVALLGLAVPQSTEPSAVDAVGTEFTIFFQENAARRQNLRFELQLFLTTHVDRPITVKVELPLIMDGSGPMQQEVTVRKGDVTEVNLPQEYMHIGSSISNKGVHILANGPIVVYGINPQKFSSEGFIAIPNKLLGTEYYAVGMPAEDQHSQLGVVAVESGSTTVTITLPDVPELRINFEGRTYGANDVIVTNLQQYQSVQLQHRYVRGRGPSGDISGARIQCTKRCAAFSGNSRTSVSGSSRDLLVEQLPPVSTWGREFAVPPTPERTDRPDILKIVCQQDGTTVLVDGQTHSCNAGGSLQLSISTSGPHFVTATKPVMAATVVMSQNGRNALIQADPAMTLIIPEEQYARSYTIATATWSGAESDGKAYDNYLTVVIRRDRIDSVVIDGVNVNTAYPDTVWTDVPSTAVGGKPALVTAYFKISSGTHTISTLLDDTKFMCIVYGAGDRESYAYMGGMRLQVINPACTQVLQTSFGDGIDNDCDARIDEEFCDGEDDDNDGATDEDCVVKNAVVAQGDVTVSTGSRASLRWTVYATDYTNFNNLQLFKKQPTAAEVLVAGGNNGMTLTDLFANTTRYIVSVSAPTKKGELYVVQVELVITDARTVDPGDYRLSYTAQDGAHEGTNNLAVQQTRQHYEIIAKDLETGSSQFARSTEPAPRNLFFQDGKVYSLTFQSVGGQHLDDLPYRLSIDGTDVTGDFEVVGLKEEYVTGTVTGLQEVKTVYELVQNRWTATSAFNLNTLTVKNAAMETVDSAVLNIDSSRIRPELSCRFELNSDGVSGRVVCDVTNVKVDIDRYTWKYDGDIILNSPGTSGPYLTTHSVASGNAESRVAVFDGIRADQWPDNSDTRVFQLTIEQSNGYTLSADTPVRLSQLPAVDRPGTVTGQVNADEASGIATVTAVLLDGSPAANDFRWTVQQNDGTFIVLVPGEGDTTPVTTNSDGNPTSTLTLRGFTTVTAHTFSASHLRDGAPAWNASRTWTVAPVTAPGVVSGEVVENSDGSITLVATVTGGSPPAETFVWTLPDNSELLPGNTAGSVTASTVTDVGDGTLRYTLTLANGRTDSTQNYRFTATAPTWSGFYTYNIPPRPTTVAAPVPGVVSGEVVENSDGSITLVATVTGGSPPAETFVWTLPDNSELLPGNTAGSVTASTVTDVGDGTLRYTLTLANGHTDSTQNYRFTATAPTWSGFYTYAIPPRPTTTAAPVPGVINGEVIQNSDGSTTLVATVTGGSPPAETFVWTLPSGNQVTPGENQGVITASPASDYGNGTQRFTLTLSAGLVDSTQIYRFTATASTWSGFYTYTVSPPTIIEKVPPTVNCALRTTNVRVGEEVEIVCTVQPSPTSDVTYTINDLVYTNILADGSQRNISDTHSHPLFRYTEQVDGSGVYVASLFFTLTENFDDLKDYKFTVEHNEGTVVVDINLGRVLTSIVNRPAVKSVVGVESQMVTLSCLTQAGGSASFGNLVWERKSLGASGRVQPIYENGELQDPFKATGRYIQSNQVTPEGLLQSTLKIVNLQRTDAAEYSCVWGSGGSQGAFVLDVIGATLIVDNNLFNGQLTPLDDSQVYNLRFEFESVSIDNYVVKYGGVNQLLTESTRNGTRFDSFSGESIPVMVYNLVDESFSPVGVFVIQTFYKDSNSDNPNQERKIRDYVLTKRPTSTDNSASSSQFLNIKVDLTEYGKDETLLLTASLPVTLSISVSAPTCSHELRVIIGNSDVTSQFTRTTAADGSRCIITLIRTSYVGDGDAGEVLKTVVVTSGGNTILSENLLNVQNPPPTTTPLNVADKTDSCADRNGGCHHRCVTDGPSTFHCECDAGYTLHSNGRVCTDNNECLMNNGGCDYICNNTEGSFTCGCPEGLRLSANGKSCIDEDECQGRPCSSTEKCVNTFGSYHCLADCDCSCCDSQPAGRKRRSVADVSAAGWIQGL